ncbi:transmembrane protein 135-like isoform X2 [Dreissena polymorpha]|uniref:transmembrane protein 135-like isoform X2 n=1 Tax=Dreissena polymorpha TaxID=45954 RepID=UPI0022643F4E|nr:transmembrane protein 135-like isoform X2 [Dreissena polymorpha]
MVALSKPTLLNYSCYELGHTWTPSCTKASLDVAKSVFVEALKIYGSLYFIAGLVRRKGKKYYRDKFLRELAQSTLFLTTNGTLFITCFCIWRKLLGTVYRRNLVSSFSYRHTIGFVPCLMAAYVAIILERKSRRGLLAMYTGNLAIETIWRMLKARGLVRSLPNGEVLLFSVAAAIYLYYFKKDNGLPAGTLSMFKKVFGASETQPSGEHVVSMVTEDVSRSRSSSRHNTVQHIWANVLRLLQSCPRHRLCRHQHACVYYVLEGSLKMFGIGYVIQAVIKLLSTITKVFRRPKTVISALFNTTNLQLGAFLAGFVGIYRGLNCVLRWCRDKDDSMHGLVAGFVAGWSMMFYKSSTIAIYSALRVAEMLYFKGIELGRLPYIRCADIILYSISTSIVFHAAVLEPHNLRPAYWNFLLRVTGNRFAEMNRKLLDPWVHNCSHINPNFWPNYDMRFTKLVKPTS